MSTAMDMFLNSSDSLPFPDNFEVDIKSEMDSLVGGLNDFSGFNFNSLEPLEFDPHHKERDRWYNSNSNSSHSIWDFSGGGGGDDTMVNPNAVLPIMGFDGALRGVGRSPSPAILKESHLTFSPATIKISSGRSETGAAIVKKDLLGRLEGAVEAHKAKIIQQPIKTILAAPKVTPILAKPSTLKPIAIRTVSNNILNNVTSQQRPVTLTVVTHTAPPSQKIIEHPPNPQNRIFPKPAYSYSCLIAMALKNSRTGSLPVSEIYGFMCRHFPYFKTAPNGWKNSVRHNLSLNKCFEKIEKPALNGAQRKGCLWAMNPAKIAKMDEEVQKWSRKDPWAIRKAMVNPENLESLERGEMKFSVNRMEEEGDEEEGVGEDSPGGTTEEEDDDEMADRTEETQVEIDVGGEIQYFHIDDLDLSVKSEIELEEKEVEMEQEEVKEEGHQLSNTYYQQVTIGGNKRRRRTYILHANN